MGIGIQDVEHLAQLARLELTEDEKRGFAERLNLIMEYVDQKFNEVNTDNVEPTSHGIQLANVLREDVVQPSLTVEQVMRNAPEEEDGQFKVPAILE